MQHLHIYMYNTPINIGFSAFESVAFEMQHLPTFATFATFDFRHDATCCKNVAFKCNTKNGLFSSILRTNFQY
ncbi:MAG: hypothetical protein BWY95_01377 [Bacteroidetes bacterium ADurb.BinA104]|nr:MAG: hypothetical protein BWY95_01377 [Bacteroidetes bacterium ADurb.BinA104]